jgi:hypothetical protein
MDIMQIIKKENAYYVFLHVQHAIIFIFVKLVKLAFFITKFVYQLVQQAQF